MLDIKFIRDNADLIKEVARRKNIDVDIDKLLKIDDKRKSLTQKIDESRTLKNAASKQIPTLEAGERLALIEKMKEIDSEQEKLEIEMGKIIVEYEKLMLLVPMYVHEDTPIGIDESGNIEIERWGEPPKFDFPGKDHIELGKIHDIIDFERAAKIGGARAYLLKGLGARLESAVLKYAMDFISRKGYTLLSVPVIVNEFALRGTGFFPGAEEEIYYLEKDDKYLVGTSEVAIGAYYANEVLDEKQLPIKFAGFSVCFRREAGSYGKDTRGLYRVHQFLKVEQFIICRNDVKESMARFKELLGNSKEFLQSLKLPYRVLNICTGDMGKGKFYMNDIETWMPSRGNYGETHSCSALLDFQARRLNLRYKDSTGKIHFCHTLNNTGVASPRILIPILECGQNSDGLINIPEILQPYLDGISRIQAAI